MTRRLRRFEKQSRRAAQHEDDIYSPPGSPLQCIAMLMMRRDTSFEATGASISARFQLRNAAPSDGKYFYHDEKFRHAITSLTTYGADVIRYIGSPHARASRNFIQFALSLFSLPPGGSTA